MNISFLIAGILCFILGIVHSILGELLIFNSKRNPSSIVPSKNSADLNERHLRIIWATWHLATFFGWCLGVILVKISLTQNELNTEIIRLITHSTIYAMMAGSILVLTATKGKHPGWIILLIIGTLLIIGN
ncbi:MAG: hypothetical protein ABJ004_00565 [Cyclobacteriaceae bacterium]